MNVRVLIIILILFCGKAFSSETPGAILLDMGLGARSIGMGDAFTAVTNDTNALYFNPANIQGIKNKELSCMYLRGLVDTNYGAFGYIFPVRNKYSLGVGLTVLDGGDIEINYSNGTSEHRKAQLDYLLILSYAKNTKIKNLSTGVSVKMLQSQLVQEANARAIGLDAGLKYDYSEKTKIGLSIQNIGTGITYSGGIASGNSADSLPFIVRAGIAGELSSGVLYKLNGALDLVKPMNESIKVHIGFEYWYKDTICFRAGYRSKYDLYSFSFGTGFRIKNYQIDYSVALMDVLGLTHYLSFTKRM